MLKIKPQAKQELALLCKSKILLFGGGKGGGKSHTALTAPLYNIHRKNYYAVLFRRTLEEVKKPGGLWDKSYELYPYLGGKDSISELKWTFPSGAIIKFSHLQKPMSHKTWYGTEIAFFAFDQLEEFTFKHFQSILGSMRTTCNIETQLFATINPINPHWVRDLIDPWIAEDGYVDLDKNGNEYYFTFEENSVKWVDEKDISTMDVPPISATFIAADIYDNQIFLQKDPQYLINLKSQPLVDRARYLGIKGRGGNWNIIEGGGNTFNRDWFNIIYEYIPKPTDKLIRFWDFGFSLVNIQKGDPTAYCLMVKRDNNYIILDCQEMRGSLDAINKNVLNKGLEDLRMNHTAKTIYHQDPGASGSRDAVNTKRLLSKLNVFFWVEKRDKVMRSKEMSVSCEQGNVSILYGNWNESFLAQVNAFPNVDHDDKVDSMTGAYNSFQIRPSSSGSYGY